MSQPNLQWQPDAHGTLNLHLPPDIHAWVQARRAYCDRGHWEWGVTGLSTDHRLAPSYYFMRLETALAEVEAFLSRALGHAPPRLANAELLEQVPTGPLHPDEPRWRWKITPEGLCAHAGHSRLSLVAVQPDGFPAPTHVEMSAEGIGNLDGSDQFPRIYLDAAHAIDEARAFLAWRLRQEPAQVPGPLTKHVRLGPGAGLAPARRKSGPSLR